ncbi:MAG: hypothetical protein AAF914_09930 [Pseudomonadota bacterium]
MTAQKKIATCCYCGTRTVLRLSARDGHELACARCGAPLHEMKPLKISGVKQTRRSAPPMNDRKPKRIERIDPWERRRKKRKKRREIGILSMLEEVGDVLEDIFD